MCGCDGTSTGSPDTGRRVSGGPYQRTVLEFSDGRRVTYARYPSLPALQPAVSDLLATFAVLPADRDARIVLKPNLNNDLNGLMGNSTDLRVLSSVIQALQRAGYRDITVADGPTAGVERRGLDVFRRLRIDRLAQALGVRCTDLNHAPGCAVTLTGAGSIDIARACLNADLLINLPKLKTHWEAGLTAATKNLMGCLPQHSKKRMHKDLIPNLMRLNEAIRPNLHLVDGLVAMEGQGPGDGRPRALHLLVAGTSNYLVDLVTARLVGFEVAEVPYLRRAAERGLLSRDDLAVAARIRPIAILARAHRRPITRLAAAPWLAPVRRLLRPVYQLPPVSALLHRHQITQDVYVDRDDEIAALTLVARRCDQCGKCRDYCPMALDPVRHLGDPRCIQCLYCAMICPREAIRLHGALGFLASHLARYRGLLQRL